MKDNVKIILAEIERLKKLPKPIKNSGLCEISIPDTDKIEWEIAVKENNVK